MCRRTYSTGLGLLTGRWLTQTGASRLVLASRGGALASATSARKKSETRKQKGDVQYSAFPAPPGCKYYLNALQLDFAVRMGSGDP